MTAFAGEQAVDRCKNVTAVASGNRGISGKAIGGNIPSLMLMDASFPATSNKTMAVVCCPKAKDHI